ncbi:MAG: HAD-IG family 5'-nucleotidase [Myxococcaceae bacterium]
MPGAVSLHGSFSEPRLQNQAIEAEARAQQILTDEELARLLSMPREKRDVDNARQIFVNRNLRMSSIEMVGFDMDYTLAIYHMRRIEQLSFDMTLTRLVAEYGYPSDIGLLHYDHQFVMRGVVVDKLNGNLIKVDRFGHVGRAYHGRRQIPDDLYRKLYRNEPIRLKDDARFAWIDTLFALPEACLYAGIIELLESSGRKVEYGKLYDNIRECIDLVHRDNSLKREIRKDIGRYIFKDPELGPALHKLRSGGKKLFVLTNSAWDYTTAVMSYLLDGVVPEYPSWRNYFDYVVCSASKPAFFVESRPLLELTTNGEASTVAGEATSMDRWKVYQGGNLATFERLSGIGGEKILYVGDHIYGDIVKSKRSSLWRTCMIVQEIEDEINYTSGRKEEITRLSEVEILRARLDDEVNHRKTQVNALERKLEREQLDADTRPRLEDEKRRAKAELDKLRKALKDANAISDTLERDVEEGFNPYWGLLFKEGNENSRFGEQVEQYACVYTSRVSNFLAHSPMQYFRSPRDLMPHEQAGALSGKLSPLGSEGPAKAAAMVVRDTL